MPQLENVEERSDEVDYPESLEDTEFEIPDGLPGSSSPRKRPTTIKYSRPESIDISGEKPVTKRRGRPPGSGRKSTVDRTKPEQFWILGTALGLNFLSAIFAAKIMNSRKYIMSEAEAKAAAQAITTVLWKYKQIREFAAIVHSDSDVFILAKGFAPYVYRAFVKDSINDLLLGLFVSNAGKPANKQPGSTNGISSTGNSNSESNGTSQPSPEFTTPDEFSIPSDWRSL